MPVLAAPLVVAADPREYSFTLSGVDFGRNTPYIVTSVDFGSAEWTVQDATKPLGDGQQPGRDFLRGGVWTVEIVTDATDSQAAMVLTRGLASVWRNGEGRRTPGSLLPLTVRVGGEAYRVYGRPRNWSADPTLVRQGTMRITAEFQLMDPLAYFDAAETLDIGLVAAGGGGVVLPAVLPWVLGSSPGQRQGVAHVAGDVATPFEVEVRGPCSSFQLAGEGWYIDIGATVAYDQTVTVDTRTSTVLRSDGASLAGKVSRRSNLRARLQPGVQEFLFRANDSTLTASAQFRWRPAMEAF